MRNRIVQLIEAANAADPSTVFLTGDLGYSVVEPLVPALGERFINMGVAEANMITVAASLAATGLKPYAYSISPFITARCLEQIRNDVCYQERAVRLIGVGSGYSYGTLGPSHHALEDATLMAALPGLIVLNPGNVAELDRCFAATLDDPRPVYFRIARESGSAFGMPIVSLEDAAYVVRDGRDVALVASGVMVSECLAAAERLASSGVSARIVSVPVLSPFPATALARLIGDCPVIAAFEGYPGNPLEIGVMRTLLATEARVPFASLAAPHAFAHTVGSTTCLRAEAGLDAAAIAKAAATFAHPVVARRSSCA